MHIKRYWLMGSFLLCVVGAAHAEAPVDPASVIFDMDTVVHVPGEVTKKGKRVKREAHVLSSFFPWCPWCLGGLIV